MIETGQDLGLTLKAGDPFRIGVKSFRQDLDRDVTAKLRVASAIDLAHAARPKRGDDFV